MTKKIFAMFLAVLMVVSMLPTSVFAAGTCPYKGTGLHTAENCDNTVIGEPVAATCNAPGFTAYKCNACGDEFHDNVTPATGAHTWENIGDIAPTCEKPGYKNAKKCSGCGKEDGETRIAPLGEKNGVQVYHCDWVITNPQINCLTGGEQIWKCANCGDEKIVKIDKKAAHAYGDFQLVTEATKDVPGKAVRTCACGAVDEVAVYAAHDCSKHLIAVEGYAKTCTTAGQHDYKECRVCGTKYGYVKDGHLVNANEGGSLTKLTNNSAYLQGEIVIPASHDFGNHVPTCADTLLQCTVATCGQWVNPGVEHDIDWVVKDEEKAKGAEYVAPSCLKPGHIYDVCANCNKRDLKTLQPLGHKPVEVKVNATCSTFAYTYTYCTRTGCDSPVVSTTDYTATLADERYNLTVHQFAFNEVAPVVGTGYYMALNHMTVGTVLYFNGQASGDYLTTSNDASQAVEVKVEKVHLLDTKGELLLYFVNEEGVKTYIEIYKKDDGKVKVRLTTDKPENVYTWNSEKKVLTTKIGSKDYFLNCYTNNQGVAYETIGASELKYAPATESTTNTTFRASLVPVNTKAVPHIITFTLNKTAGLGTSHPAWNTQVVTAATCTVDGLKIVSCKFCGSTHEEAIPATHTWRNATNDEVPGKTEDAFQAVGCVDGWQWKICSVQGCGATKKDTVTGSGHVYGDVVEFVPNHIHTTGNDTKTCKYCNDPVNLTYRVWEYIGVQFESLTAAQTAHGGASNLTNGKVLSTGDCTTTGLTRYTCAGCQKDVLVKTEGEHLAPTEINGIPVHQDPTCTEKGWDLTYKCQREGCGAIIGAAKLGEKNDIAALGHNPVVAEDHEHANCDSPNYNATHSACDREGCTYTVKCFVLNEEITVYANSGADLCEKSVIEYYWCAKCNDEHIRGFVEVKGHEMAPVLNAKGEIDYTFKPGNGLADAKAPTCTEEGLYYVQCEICGKYEPKVAPMIAHVNKAEEKFFNNCKDTVIDRHCVVCCVCDNKGASHSCLDNDPVKAGNQPCDCVIPAEHQWNKVLMPSNCSMAPYWAKSCPDCGARENEVVTEAKVYEYVNTAAEGEEANYEWVLSAEKQAIVHMGHKPAEIDYREVIGQDGKPTGTYEAYKLPGYTYEEYTYVWYTVDGENLYKNEETYMAKFIERKSASYTEEGYDHFECQICQSEKKNMIAKKTGLGFELSITNDVVTYGTLVEIVVSANGNNASVHGFDFSVSVPANAQFVGYEKLNDNFNMVVTAPEKADNEAKLSAFAVNTAEGKKQNVVIDSETALVKLFFRVTKDVENVANGFVASVVKANTAVSVLKNDVSTKIENFENFEDDKCNTQMFLDFNKDGFRTSRDLHDAMSMITLESNKTYDVTVDVNKDGVVDLQDLSIAYNYLVGNYDLAELLVMGISAEELAHLDLAEKVLCNNPACKYELDADWNRCPMCGNYQ